MTDSKTEVKGFGRSVKYNAHNTRSLIRTLEYVQGIIAYGKNFYSKGINTHIHTTAAKLTKNALKNFIIPQTLWQNYLSQAICAATRPRTVKSLLFGLAVTANSRMSSHWLNNVLLKCEFAVSYGDVTLRLLPIWSQLVSHLSCYNQVRYGLNFSN